MVVEPGVIEEAPGTLEAKKAENPYFPWKSHRERTAADFIHSAQLTEGNAKRYLEDLKGVFKAEEIEISGTADITKKLATLPVPTMIDVDLTSLFADAEQKIAFKYRNVSS